MESTTLLSKIKMEVDMDSFASGAFWLPSFEADSFNNTNANESLGYDASSPDHRRKVASQLLEALEDGSQKHQQDEPYCGWLEEPMDLEVFGQSLAETSESAIPLDDEEPIYISGPSSPLVSLPSTPIQPSSPQELYPPVDDLPVVKFDESNDLIPAENAELLESLELLLHQIQQEGEMVDASNSVHHEVKEDEEDVATALLDSLIKGNVEESQVFDELAEFSLAIIDPSELELILPTPIPPPSFISPPSSVSSCSETDDQEWAPPCATTQRKNRAGTSQPVQRKPRKKNLKVEDRRVRKKEQNKTAATRYRMKKKAELEILLEEESALEQRNRQLQAKHDELASEVRYLKKLMKEVLVAKSGKRR